MFVFNISTQSNLREIEMVTDEEGQTVDLFLLEIETFTDYTNQISAILGVVVVGALADIMKKACQKKDMGRSQGEEDGGILLLQKAKFCDTLEEMAVNCIDVINVMLGQRLQVFKFRDVSGEQPCFQHVSQNSMGILALQNREEGLGHPFGMTGLVVNQSEFLADQGLGVVMNG
jgi:hypothetical protein